MAGPDLGKPQFAAHAVVEPIGIVCIMIVACYANRHRGYQITPPSMKNQGLLGHSPELELLAKDARLKDDEQGNLSVIDVSRNYGLNRRGCCGTGHYTPNTSPYANHWHSRFIQKFPFLVEMFYWVINALLYASIKSLSELIFASEGVWKTAEGHAISILLIEESFSFLFPIREVDVQTFFRIGHRETLTVLNRAYSLVHIPATVSFLAWYYYAAPTHAHFASARRMMTLTNVLCFTIFTAYPCMPPRLLPEKYGFFDTVRRENAESLWASGKFFNQLAALPSLHFGYSFCIGTVLLFHSGVLLRSFSRRKNPMSKFHQVFFVGLSIVYPCFVLVIIIATANHYWLDALAATVVVGVAWLCNRCLLVLLPLEVLLLKFLKLEKPIPTTGDRGS